MKQIGDAKLYFFFLIPMLIVIGCLSQKILENTPVTIQTKPANGIRGLTLEFQKGQAFTHPSFAIWVENTDGDYIESLYVTRYVAKGEFRYGELAAGKWKNEPGEVRRPATLPYWSHKRNIKAPDGLYIPSPETALPDALTSATPKEDFMLNTLTSYSGEKNFRILMEINQAWDSNKYWTNSRFTDDNDYAASLQPAIVYSVTIDMDHPSKEYHLNPIGHSHPSGTTGELFTDLTTLTTAKEIAHKIIVRLK